MQPDLQALALTKAIRQKESGGNYKAVGDAGTSTGAYQFQPATWKGYAKDILGDSNAPMTEENQNAVTYGKIKQWKDSGLGPAEIAGKWNSGSEKGWENKVGTTTINGQKIKYNTPQYAKDVVDIFKQKYNEVSAKYGSQQPTNEPFKYDVAQPTETREQKIARYTAESADLQKKSDDANSILGFTKNFLTAGRDIIASSEVALGNTLSKIIGQDTGNETYGVALQDLDTTQANLIKLIRQKELKGEDTTKLKQIYNSGEEQRKTLQAGLNETNTLPTTGQAVGQLGGTALDILTAGTYSKGKGLTTGVLGKELPSATNLLTKPTGLFTKQGAGKVATGAGIGYGYDVSMGLQEGEENPYKLGIMTLLGGVLTTAPQLVKTGEKLMPDSANIMQRQVKLTNPQEVKFKQMTGEDIGEFLSKRDLNRPPEEIVSESTKRFINSYQEADDALAQLPGKYKFEPVRTALDDLIEREKIASTPGTKSANSEAINDLVKKYDEGGLTMSEINQVKRIYEKEVKLPYMKEMNSLQVDRSGRIDSAIREWQLKKADDLGFKNLREINKQTQAYKFIADKVSDRLTGIKTNNALSLTDIVLLAGGDLNSLTMFATKRLFSNAKLQTLIARLARNKKLDVQEVKAIFGGVKGLPAKIPGIDYNISKPIQLPKSAREFNLGLDEIKNAKQGQQLSQELLSKPYTKDMIKKDASQVMDMMRGINDKEKADLLDILRVNNYKVYKEVREKMNKEMFDKYQSLKGKTMSEKMVSIYEPYTAPEDLPVIKMGNTPKKVDTSGLPEIQLEDTTPIKRDKTYVRPKPNTKSGKINIGEDKYDTVAKALMDYDTTPMMVDGKLDLNYSEPDFRLGQLQDKIRKQALTDAEVKEAEKLLQERGALEKSKTEKGSIVVNPLTVGAGVTAVGAGAMSIKNKKKK